MPLPLIILAAVLILTAIFVLAAVVAAGIADEHLESYRKTPRHVANPPPQSAGLSDFYSIHEHIADVHRAEVRAREAARRSAARRVS